jgi:hypothetical protein
MELRRNAILPPTVCLLTLRQVSILAMEDGLVRLVIIGDFLGVLTLELLEPVIDVKKPRACPFVAGHYISLDRIAHHSTDPSTV